MLAEKHKPRSLKEMEGQEEAIKYALDWIRNWKRGKALLVHGPPGSGKTLIPTLLAEEMGLELLEMNASDERNASSIDSVLGTSSKQRSLSGKGKIIFVDEVDGISPRDRGAVSSIIKVIEESSFPVILTANDAYEKNIRNLRGKCDLLKLKKVGVYAMERIIERVCSKEGIEIGKDAVRQLAKMGEGDARAVLNDIYALSGRGKISLEDLGSLGSRNRQKDIFEVLNAIFKSKGLKNSISAVDSSDKDLGDLFWWVEENLHLALKGKELAEAFEILSKADLLRAKAHKHYRLLFYEKVLLSGIGQGASSHGFISYKPPQKLVMLGRSKAQRAGMDESAESFGRAMHCSKRKVKENMAFLKLIARNEKWLSSMGRVCPNINEIF